MSAYRLLTTAEEVDALLSDDVLSEAVDWFDNERTMPTDDFLDRLFGRYGGPVDSDGKTLDLDSLDNEAARRIMSRARKIRREREL